MPDEQSNLNTPAQRRSAGNSRRRGRRGGRGRGLRPVATKPGAPGAGEISPTPEIAETGGETGAPVEAVESAPPGEHEAEPTGGFREPHSDVPEGFSSHEVASSAEAHEPEPAAEAASDLPPARPSQRDMRREPRRDDRREERPPQPPPRIPPAQRQWVKPADFRPATPTAITQAVEHAMFIATALKDLHDQMDEVLELVEIAERQKIADERELEELRRALRRIQPQRQQQPSQRFQPPQRPQPRREEPRQQPPREQMEKREEPPSSPEAEQPHTD